jgi:hypothetical protein
MDLPLPKLALMAGVLLSIGAANAQVLFSDNYSVSASNDNVNFEYDVPGRQGGTLGPIFYTEANAANDFQHQVRGPLENPPQVMYIVGTDFSVPSASVSLDQNFNTNPGLGNYMSISFKVDPVLNGDGTSGEWAGLSVGASDANRNKFINDAGEHFGIVFQDNGGYQAFEGSVALGTGTYSLTPTITLTHQIELRLTGLVDGNPFDGSGDALIEVFADGDTVPFFTYTKTAGYTDNYTTLSAFGGFNVSVVDDLQIAVVAVPEPQTWVLMLGGLFALVAVQRHHRRARPVRA